MIKTEELFDKVNSIVVSFNAKIYSGQRLSSSESEEFSKNLKLLPPLNELNEIRNDLDFALSNPTTFDENFIQDLKNKFTEAEEKVKTVFREVNKESIGEFIMEMRSGAGGDEAALFCRDLFSAYEKYLLKNNISHELIDFTEDNAGGFVNLVMQVTSEKAYDLFINEGGVHRVQRVPSTESSGRIHTSTISVAILPISKKKTIVINPNDLVIDVYRSGGHGGQSVNTTDSAVRITHLPSGLVVTCQNTKSQIKNKEMAMKVLEARLDEIENTNFNKGVQDLRTKQVQTMDRSEKIRTYNYLQDRITDHRVKLDFSGINRFMEGDIKEVLEKINRKLAADFEAEE